MIEVFTKVYVQPPWDCLNFRPRTFNIL